MNRWIKEGKEMAQALRLVCKSAFYCYGRGRGDGQGQQLEKNIARWIHIPLEGLEKDPL